MEKQRGSQVHHIFRKSDFPELSDTIENLIFLTPNQHFQYAHPNNNTNIVDLKYQIICLLYKLKSILNNKDVYEFCQFLTVLDIGLCNDEEYFRTIKENENTMEEVSILILKKYKEIYENIDKRIDYKSILLEISKLEYYQKNIEKTDIQSILNKLCGHSSKFNIEKMRYSQLKEYTSL